MDVLFLHGPAAVGEYTIGTLLSTLLDRPLFHNHLVVDAVLGLFEFGSPAFCQAREDMWLTAFKTAAVVGQSFVFTFTLEASVAPDLVSRLQAEVSERGGRVWYVELVCSAASQEVRLQHPARAQFAKLRDVTVLRSLRAQGVFDFPALPPPLLRIDTDCLAPIEAARQIATTYANATQ